MPPYASISGKRLIIALQKDGYIVVRQKGSHIRLHHPRKDPVTIPAHTVGKGLLRKILRDAELTPKQPSSLL